MTNDLCGGCGVHVNMIPDLVGGQGVEMHVTLCSLTLLGVHVNSR